VAGIVTAAVLVLFGLVLVQLGLTSQGQEFSFDLFSPYEFWKSFSGLVVEWSQWNEWLLLGLGIAALLAAGLLYVWWRRSPRVPDTPGHRRPFLKRMEDGLHGTRSVTVAAMLALLFLGAYAYQQYLWNVELPVPKDQIGVAFTRQVGSSVARDQLADYLRQMGHEGKIVMRDLPVTFDARDTAKARQMATRIGADAVVIYREEQGGAPAVQQAGRVPGLAAPLAQSDAGHFVAYIVFADPSLGIEIPVPQHDPDGKVTSVQFRAKQGVDVPRLEASTLSRLMEASAGILLYNQDRYLPAIAHLRNSIADSGHAASADALAQFYLGNAYYLLGQDGEAADALSKATAAYEQIERPGVQDRLILAAAYNQEADLLFWQNEHDQAEAMLRKAVALREPLQKDESALSDPGIFRRAHDTFGSTYLGLMQIAQFKQDADAITLWAERAKDEADALMGQPDDKRARTSAIWMTYRTGACEDAYKLASDMLAADPNDITARNLLHRVASIRSGFTSTEARQHLDALIELDPQNLPNLQSLLLYYSLMQYTGDPAYIEQVKSTVERILAVDPNNVEAIASYVRQVTSQATTTLNADPNVTLYPVGHPQTFRRLRAEWAGDPARIKAAIADAAQARPYITRWVEELQPESARPLIQAAQLDFQDAFLAYNFLQIQGKQDAEIEQQYPAMWQRAVKSAERILGDERNPTDYEQLKAQALLSQLWSYDFWRKFFKPDVDAAGTSIEEALKHVDAGRAILEAHPPATKQEIEEAQSAYLDLFGVVASARSFYTSRKDTAKAGEYATVQNDLIGKWTALSQQMLDQAKAEEAFVTGARCTTGTLPAQARQAAAGGDYSRAVELMQQYTGYYPGDPDGWTDRGWFEYEKGDVDAALASTEEAGKLAPDHPFPPANLTIMWLSERQGQAAEQSLTALLENFDARPLIERLNYLTSVTGDLVALARENEHARDGVKGALVRLDEYVAALPAEAKTDAGSLLVVVRNNLAAAGVWAGDYERAQAQARATLDINPDYVLARTNLGAALLAAGDEAGAEREYDAAIDSAATYLKGVDGANLEGDALATASAAARSEIDAAVGALEALVEQKPELRAAAAPLMDNLRQAASEYGG
jgi:tetratricopeptide (TPR) repeat protein